MREEYYLFSTISDEQLYHLAFTEHHQAFYFHQFTRLIDEAGLQFLGDAWTEWKLIALAYSYEQATRHRRPPPTTPRLPCAGRC